MVCTSNGMCMHACSNIKENYSCHIYYALVKIWIYQSEAEAIQYIHVIITEAELMLSPNTHTPKACMRRVPNYY